jgi:hypothetical protein
MPADDGFGLTGSPLIARPLIWPAILMEIVAAHP